MSSREKFVKGELKEIYNMWMLVMNIVLIQCRKMIKDSQKYFNYFLR